MTNKQHIKYIQLIQNNKYQSILMPADVEVDLNNSMNLPVTIEERDLHCSAQWQNNLEVHSKVGKTYLLIAEIDTLPQNEQDKFVPLLKDRRAGLFNLPDNVQIILSAKNINNVSENIKAHTLYFRA